MDRLKEVYGDKSYPLPRIELLWDWAKKLQFDRFQEAISVSIAENAQAPLLPKIQEAYLRTKSKFEVEKIDCPYCNGEGWYTPRNAGPLPDAYRCRCPAGDKMPKYVPQWKGDLERYVPTPAELSWNQNRKITSIVSNSMKKIDNAPEDQEPQ